MKRALPPPVHQDTNTCATCGAVYFALLAPCRPWVCGRCIALAAEVHTPVEEPPHAPPRSVFPSPLLGLRGLVGTLAVLVLLLSSCIPLPCSNCLPVPTPTPTQAEGKPTPRATETPASIRPGALTQLTSGRAVLELDLSGFRLAPGIDTYAFLTACWLEPYPPISKPQRPTTPCVQLGLRGSDPADMRIEVRESSNIRFDGTPGLSEALMCGSGTRPNKWIKLPAGVLRPTVALEWSAGLVKVSTVAGGATLTQGAVPGFPQGSTAVPGYGWWTDGIPLPGGLGWSYMEAWTFKAHGGAVRLLSWSAVGVQGQIGTCP